MSLHNVLLRCELLLLVICASIPWLVFADPSISPTFALLGHATTFVIKDVKHPYLICTTTFPESKKQAVYASVSKKRSGNEREATCVVDAPSMPANVASLDAEISTIGAARPRGKMKEGKKYMMKFVQPPRVMKSDMQYYSGDEPGYHVTVTLQNPGGLRKVKSQVNAAMKLQVDMSVIGLNTISLSGFISFSKDTATATFRLQQLLPNGRYPCVLTISGHPVGLADSEPGGMKDGPQTRAQDLFNSSDSAEAAPLMQRAEEHTFMVAVSAPAVVIAPATVSESAVAPCLFGSSDAKDCDEASTAVPGQRHPPLWLSLKGQPGHGAVSALLAVFVANSSISETDVLAIARDVDADVTADPVVVLPRPTNKAPVSSLWVEWHDDSPWERRLLLQDSEEAFPEDGFFVRVLRTVAATVDRRMQSAWVAPLGQPPESPPVFSVEGQQVVHRGDVLTFRVRRQGLPSDRESQVQWRLVYLDPRANSENALLDTGSVICGAKRCRTGIDAMQQAGLVMWEAGDDSTEREVNVTVSWDAVPYGTRWMFAVRLSVRQNGAIAYGDFLPQGAPPPSAPVAPQPEPLMMDQMSGIVPVVPGDTDAQAASVHAIVYGVPEGACAPSMGRAAGSPVRPPLPADLSKAPIHSISVRVSADRHTDVDAVHQYAQTTPPFDGRKRMYLAMVPFDMGNASLVVSTVTGQYVSLEGCGVQKQTAPVATASDSSVEAVSHNFWPLSRPANSSKCMAVVRACLGGSASRPSCPGSALTHEMTVSWLDDPALAQINAVNVTISGSSSRVCSSTHREEERVCDDAIIRPGANATTHMCAVDVCKPHSFLNTSLTYHRGESIQIVVQPMRSGRVGTVSIGPRVFRATADGELDRVSVSFKLFDASDRLSPFLPFFIRQRTRERTVLDVPVMLTLADGITAVPFTLLLDVDVRAKSGATPRTELSVTSSTTDVRPGSAPINVELVAESAHVSFLTDGVATAEAPFALSDAPAPASRRLLEASTSAPQDQMWLEDPLDEEQCDACPEGFYSDNVDVLCQRCTRGSCAPYTGMVSCSVCPAGSYAPVHGASSCAPCVHGSYADLPGSSACRLCPFGYTTESDGAIVCDSAVEQTVAVGKQYALAVSFSVRLMGMGFHDVPQRTGVLGSSEDILQFLVSLDSAAAFKVSTADVQVSSMTELQPQMLRINVTTNIAIDAPKNASKRELDRAVSLAQLSKDNGIGNLTWDHTTEALGASAVTEDQVETQVIEPDTERRVSWEAIVMPILAGLIILGSVMFLKIQRTRDHGLDTLIQTPSMLMTQALAAMRSAICPTTVRNRTHHLSDMELPSDIVSECDQNLELDMRPRNGCKCSGTRTATEGIELNSRVGSDARKRPVTDVEM